MSRYDARQIDALTNVYNVETLYGAQPDAYYTDGVSNSSTTFTSASAAFTSADVGKTIVIERCGSAGNSIQWHHTTISAVTNATTITLAAQTRRTQASNVYFYISRSGDQTAAIQAAINACALAGGGQVYLPGVGYLVSTLTLKNRVRLMGSGMASTLIHQIAGTNANVVQNDNTLNNYAEFCSVEKLTIDGNRQRQTELVLNLAAGNYPGGGNVSVATGTGSQIPFQAGAFMLQGYPTGAAGGSIVIASTAASGSLINVATVGVHGLTTGWTVVITGSNTETNGVWHIAVVDTTHFTLDESTWTANPGAGDVKVQCRFGYQSVSGDTLTIISNSREGTVDAGILTTGATLTFQTCNGLYLVSNPFNTVPTLAEYGGDTHFICRDIRIQNCLSDGVGEWGWSSSVYDNVWCEANGNIGLRPSYDTFSFACVADWNGRIGFYAAHSENIMIGCKAFYNGRSKITLSAAGAAELLVAISSEGWGFAVENNNGEGSCLYEGCQSQDNASDGFLLHKATRLVLNGSASNNGRSQTAGRFSGMRMDAGSGNIINLACTDVQATATQTSAIFITARLGQAVGNIINITHGTSTGGGNLSDPIKSGSTITGGNTITVNGSPVASETTSVFATTYTPDPYKAATHVITAMSAALTINAPAAAAGIGAGAGMIGQRLRFVIVRDATVGAFAVTLNAVFKAAALPTLAASQRMVMDFEFDGTSWNMVGAAPAVY